MKTKNREIKSENDSLVLRRDNVKETVNKISNCENKNKIMKKLDQNQNWKSKNKKVKNKIQKV